MSQSADDYKQAAQMLPSEYLGSRFTASGVDDAAVKAIYVKTLFKDNALEMGVFSGSDSGYQHRGVALSKLNRAIELRHEQQRKNGVGDVVFLDLLQRIDDLNQDLGEIRARNEGYEAELVDEYGDDYLEDMAQTYLSEEELESLDGLNKEQREQEIKALLADKMLNEDGTIKEGFQDLTIAKLLQGEKEAQDITSRIGQMQNAHDSGDRKMALEALKNDEQGSNIVKNAAVSQPGKKLAGKFENAAENSDQQAVDIVKTIEEKDVEADSSPDASLAAFDSFGNV
jgi:hypothetical protein